MKYVVLGEIVSIGYIVILTDINFFTIHYLINTSIQYIQYINLMNLINQEYFVFVMNL